MNNDLLYTVDPYIISLLFLAKNDEEALNRYNMILEDVVNVTNATMKEYLLENKFSEIEVDEVLKLDDIDKAHPKFKPYLQNIILIDKINYNVKALLKTYYDILLKTLPEDKKIELDNYLKENQAILEERQAIVKEGLGLLKNLLEENGVETVADLERKIGPMNYGENVNTTTEVQVSTESPSINLGGATTNPSVEPTVAAIEEVKEEPVTPQNVEVSEQTINPIPVDDANQEMSPLVNMALDSTINNFQQPEEVNQENTQAPVEPTQVVEPVNELNNIPVEAPVESTANEDIKFTPITEVEQITQVQQEPVQEPVVETQLPEIQTPEVPVLNQEAPSFNAVQTVSPMNFINPIQQEIPVPPMPDQNPGLPEIQVAPENVVTEPIAQPISDIQPIQIDQQLPQTEQVKPQLSAINRLDGLGINLDNPVSNTQQ